MLKIDSRPACIEIVGIDQDAIHVSCTANDTDSGRHIRLRFSGTPTNAKLTVTGSYLKHGNLQIRGEVPRKMNLGVQMSAGEVKVDEIVALNTGMRRSEQFSVTMDQVNEKTKNRVIGGSRPGTRSWGCRRTRLLFISKRDEPIKNPRVWFETVVAAAGLKDVTRHTLRHYAECHNMPNGCLLWGAT